MSGGRGEVALDADPDVEAADEAAAAGYGQGAKILSIGIASTGLFTFAYFSVASHLVDDEQLGAINLLWTILFIAMSVFYRPVEQLLSRTIATRRAHGLHNGHPLRSAATLQLGFMVVFLGAAFIAHGRLVDAFDGSESLFWVLVVAAAAYAVSYFARGFFAGNEWFGFYGGLVLFESVSRFAFPVAVALGVASGQTAVALGIAAAPLASLLVLPAAVRRQLRTQGAARPAAQADGDATRAGDGAGASAGVSAGASAGAEVSEGAGVGAAAGAGGFAVAVALVQLGEQTLLNAAALLVPSGATVAVVFAAFLITRAPLQLFQSVQTSLLPHLAGLEAKEGGDAFGQAIRVTLLAVAGFAAAVAVGLLLLGPVVMPVLFDVDTEWSGLGLAAIAAGMGFHLAAGTLNQAALARGQAAQAATAWVLAAALFVAWMLAAVVDEPLARAEVGYLGATMLLCLTLRAVYRRPRAAAAAR